jgi:hypothetical protein
MELPCSGERKEGRSERKCARLTSAAWLLLWMRADSSTGADQALVDSRRGVPTALLLCCPLPTE